MRLKLIASVTAMLMPLGCGQMQDSQNANENAEKEMSSEEQAANELYLEDMEDSATEETTSEGEATENTEEVVKEDRRTRRLAQMVEMMFSDLDADASGNLSLEEFLAGPEKRAVDAEVSEEKQAKMVEKLTADFSKYAGDDALMTKEELSTLLKSVAPRIGRHRNKKFPGKQGERVKKSWEDIVQAFDADGDGKLSKGEFESMENARKKEHRKPLRQKKG